MKENEPKQSSDKKKSCDIEGNAIVGYIYGGIHFHEKSNAIPKEQLCVLVDTLIEQIRFMQQVIERKDKRFQRYTNIIERKDKEIDYYCKRIMQLLDSQEYRTRGGG